MDKRSSLGDLFKVWFTNLYIHSLARGIMAACRCLESVKSGKETQENFQASYCCLWQKLTKNKCYLYAAHISARTLSAPSYCSQRAPASSITPHKATCCCVICAWRHCGEFIVQQLCACQPEQDSHYHGSWIKCLLLNNLKDSVSARGISSTYFSSSIIYPWYCGS